MGFFLHFFGQLGQRILEQRFVNLKADELLFRFLDTTTCLAFTFCWLRLFWFSGFEFARFDLFSWFLLDISCRLAFWLLLTWLRKLALLNQREVQIDEISDLEVDVVSERLEFPFRVDVVERDQAWLHVEVQQSVHQLCLAHWAFALVTNGGRCRRHWLL